MHSWIALTDAAVLDNWVRWHIAEERQLTAEVLAVKTPRTEENTLRPLDRALMHVTLSANQVELLFQTHPDKSIRDKAQELAQVLAAEQTALSLNQGLYRAVAAVDVSHADAATRHYVERSLLEYRLAGVDKDQATRDKVKQLQKRMTDLSFKFSRNVQDDVRRISVKDEAYLAGLPGDYIARHKPATDGAITLTTDSPDMDPVMSYAQSAKLRRAMFLAYENRAYPANEEVLRQLLEVRQDLAATLGYQTWAGLASADMMIESARNMQAFLNEVDLASRDRAAREFNLLETFVRQKDPSALPVTISDGGYWAEQYRRSAFAFDSQSARPYFPYAQVEAGILQTASRLFHLEFRAAPTAVVWDPSVHTYDVFDGGQKAGRIYLDMHPREGKDKWFSEAPLIPGLRGEQLPEAALICNFPGGLAGDPGLMEFADVETFFHEFGHMMHEVLGGKQRLAGQSGITTEGDFAEAPSEMLEEFFHNAAVLQSFAKHYQTGEIMPLDLIHRMNRASYYGRARRMQGSLLAASYSLQLHERPPSDVDFDALLKQDTKRFSPLRFVDGDHFYASFTHLTDYSSNYYMYALDRVIAVDFFAAFDPNTILDGPTALRYRRTVLEPGGSKPAAQLIRDFLGRPQNMDALKRWMDEEFTTSTDPTPVAGSQR